jgi:hypothetical protein
MWAKIFAIATRKFPAGEHLPPYFTMDSQGEDSYLIDNASFSDFQWSENINFIDIASIRSNKSKNFQEPGKIIL